MGPITSAWSAPDNGQRPVDDLPGVVFACFACAVASALVFALSVLCILRRYVPG